MSIHSFFRMEHNRNGTSCITEGMKPGVTVSDRGKAAAGLILVLTGFLMPMVFTVRGFRVQEILGRAVAENNALYLIASAMRLVALNAVRALPHYIGAFLIAESLDIRTRNGHARYLNALLLVATLLVTYRAIDIVWHIHYDFGLPAFLCAGFLILFDRLDYAYVAVMKKIMVISMALIAFQFLDVMPAVKGFPVGRGEISTDIRMVAGVMREEANLNLASAIGLTFFSLFCVLFLFLLRDENRLREMAALKEQNELIRTQAYISAMQNRAYREMQHLVHDLKSPLTVVATLAGTEKMRAVGEGRPDDGAIMERIENAIDGMDRMISEMLDRESAHPVRAERLLNQVSSALSIEPYHAFIHFETRDPDARICVNRVMFTRAIVNLVHNSAVAIPEGRDPEITVESDVVDGYVRFLVSDNGSGVPQEIQREIWERGISGSSSSGLGLAFVRQVVEEADGEIRMDSRPGEGTRITLLIPEYTADMTDGGTA